MQLIYFFFFSVNFFYQIMYQENKKDIYITINTIYTEKMYSIITKKKRKFSL